MGEIVKDGETDFWSEQRSLVKYAFADDDDEPKKVPETFPRNYQDSRIA